MLMPRMDGYNALAAWLVPTEFMDVNYGEKLKEYLAYHVSLKQIHRFRAEDIQFTDALVSSAVLIFEKKKPSISSSVTMSFGGTLTNPNSKIEMKLEELRRRPKWTQISEINGNETFRKSACPKLGDFFTIKRGLATGNNSFFIIDEKKAVDLEISKNYYAQYFLRHEILNMI